MTIFLSEDDVAYFDALTKRAAGAAAPRRQTIIFRDGSEPRRNDCHANAARRAAEDPAVVPVHGWLIETDHGGFRRLAAHSLLRDGAGTLIDITPIDQEGLAFIEHEGSAADFFALLPRFNSITWPPPQML
nr:hypothetical protein [uncultured Brevundimonas sp.]